MQSHSSQQEWSRRVSESIVWWIWWHRRKHGNTRNSVVLPNRGAWSAYDRTWLTTSAMTASQTNVYWGPFPAQIVPEDMKDKAVFICTLHGIICMRSPSDTASHLANDLDQLKTCWPAEDLVCGNYAQTPNHEIPGAEACSKCKFQSMHAAEDTFLASQAAAPWMVSSFFLSIMGERGFFHSLICSLPQTPITASSFSLLLNGAQHPSQPTLALHVRASCYCQGKTSSFFPLPCGLCVLSLVLSAFASPTRKRIECKYSNFCTQAQNLSCSRAAEPLPRHTTYVINKRVLLSPFPSSLMDMALPVT